MKEEQAEAYLEEARRTLKAAKAIERTASEDGTYAQVVKNGYDALEQAASAAIAKKGKDIPKSHAAKIKRFVECFDIDPSLRDSLFKWLRERGETQYVDYKEGELKIPHHLFNRGDAEEILEDARQIIQAVEEEM